MDARHRIFVAGQLNAKSRTDLLKSTAAPPWGACSPRPRFIRYFFSLCPKAIAVSYHVRFSTYGRSMSVPISHTPPMHQPIPFRTAARRMRKRTNKTKRPHSRCGPFFFNVVMMYLPSIHLRRETALFFLVCHRSFFSTPLLSHRNVNFRKQICQIVSKRKCDATMTNG